MDNLLRVQVKALGLSNDGRVSTPGTKTLPLL